MQLISNIFYSLSFVVNFAFVAGINSFVSMFRLLIFYLYERKRKEIPIWWIFVFSSIYILVGILFFNNYTDILVMITPIIFTVALYMKNMQTVHYLLLLPNAILVVYAFICEVYTTALLDLIEFVVIIISIIKFYIQKKHEIRYLL